MRRMGWKTLLALIAGFTLILVAPKSVQTQSGVQYVYDELGRLVGAIDPSGNAAAYSYDPVGNLLSITRYAPTQVSIIQFTPKSGPVGTTVTISGTGFSTTASQNTVTFNGTSATVTSATANQLVTSVPSGATTGPIAVASPNGSVTSSAAFIVTASSGAPTISSFTPTIGTPGAGVTVTGSNFDLVPANDKLQFNFNVNASTSSASATSLGTSVPTGGTSGHISLATPTGSVMSSGDFFIPPSPHVTSDVVFTTRVAIGGSTTVTINTASKIGLVVFDGTAGQSISLLATNMTITQAGVTIFTPAGGTVFFGYLSSSSNFIDALTLPVTGTYTIMVAPTSTYTGSMTLNLYNVVDVTGTITPGGSAVTVTTTTPGQNARIRRVGGAAGEPLHPKCNHSRFYVSLHLETGWDHPGLNWCLSTL